MAWSSFSILAILLVIAAQVVPLFRAPSATPAPTVAGAAARAPAAGRRRISRWPILPRPPAWPCTTWPMAPAGGVTQAVAAVAGDARTFALGLADGRILPCSVAHDTTILTNRARSPPPSPRRSLVARTDGRPVDLFAFVATPDGPLAVARIDSNRVAVLS